MSLGVSLKVSWRVKVKDRWPYPCWWTFYKVKLACFEQQRCLVWTGLCWRRTCAPPAESPSLETPRWSWTTWRSTATPPASKWDLQFQDATFIHQLEPFPHYIILQPQTAMWFYGNVVWQINTERSISENFHIYKKKSDQKIVVSSFIQPPSFWYPTQFLQRSLSY